MSNKQYAVKASGHGSRFRFDNPIKLMTLNEAIKDALHWIGIADTIGGDARVIHMPTGIQVWPK